MSIKINYWLVHTVCNNVYCVCSSSSQRHCPEGRIFVASHLSLLVLYVVFFIATAATFADVTGTVW